MIIKNAKVFIDGQFHDYDVRTENGIITEIADRIDGEGFDAEGKYLFAGFIDVHFHGACDAYCGDSIEKMEEIARTIPQYGVTGYIPTPLSRDRFEWWVNGRQIEDDNIVILSPTSWPNVSLISFKLFISQIKTANSIFLPLEINLSSSF